MKTGIYRFIGRYLGFRAGDKVVVRKHVEEIGAQEPYTYYTIQQSGNRHYLIKSYDEHWDAVISLLEPYQDATMSYFLYDLGVFELDGILEQLELDGKLSRKDIEEAVENYNNRMDNGE
jgi:hypothetical protein